MSELQKTTITVTVLTEEPMESMLRDLWDLSDLEHLITWEHAIGSFAVTKVEAVPEVEKRRELIALGNDGTFFDEPDDDGEWVEFGKWVVNDAD